MHAAAVLALIAATQAPATSPATPPARAASEARSQPDDGAALPAGWAERRSREGGFAALMPCEPAPLGDPADLPSAQGTLRLTAWGCEVGPGAGYGVVVMEFPPAAAAELTAAALDQMAERMTRRSAGEGARLVRSARRAIAGAPARDLELERDGRRVRFLVVLDGRRLLQAVASRDGVETIPGSERFYDSFRPLRRE